MLTQINKLWIAVFGVLLSVTFTSQASDKPTDDPNPTVEELMAVVDRSLPQDLIGDDNTKLVAQLLNPQLGKPLSQSFDAARVIKTLFGRGGASLSPDCRILATPVGDLSEDECVASKGSESGAGAYRMLRFSKHMALGNIVYTNRTADQIVDPLKLAPVRMTDQEAYDKAISFLKGLGLPAEEFPVIPASAKQLPVRTVALGWADPKGTRGATPVEKMVMVPRGLLVDANPQLPQVAGPGNALVVMDDLGVKEAIVSGWQEVMPHPKADSRNAKTRTELIREIAEDLAMDIPGPVSKINMQIKLMVAATENGVGLLLPAVQAAVMPVARDLTEAQQEELGRTQATTAGFIRDYSLVNIPQVFAPGDDEKLIK